MYICMLCAVTTCIFCRFVSAGERGLYVMVMSTLLGAWLGAIPIPLDWNRPWQARLSLYISLTHSHTHPGVAHPLCLWGSDGECVGQLLLSSCSAVLSLPTPTEPPVPMAQTAAQETLHLTHTHTHTQFMSDAVWA